MAYVKVIKSEGKSISRVIHYVGNPLKAQVVSGLNVSDDPETAIQQMNATKELYDKVAGRQYKHFVQSFKPGEVTPEKANQLALEFAAENFKGFEVFIGTHADCDHIHNHFVVNSVNIETGEKYHKDAHFLEHLRQESDKICLREGLTVIKPRKPEQITEFQSAKQNEYQLMNRIVKGQKTTEGKPARSYKLELAVAVRKAQSQAGNREEFIAAMQLQGYKTVWLESRKNITFEDKDGNRVRLANLEKTYNDSGFSKEGLERAFAQHKTNNQQMIAAESHTHKYLYGTSANQIRSSDEKLRGIITDLSYFNHHETLKISEIEKARGNESLYNAINRNFIDLEKQKLVTIDIKNKELRITEQGRKLIESQKFNDILGEIKKNEQLSEHRELMKQQGFLVRVPVLKRGTMNHSPQSLQYTSHFVRYDELSNEEREKFGFTRTNENSRGTIDGNTGTVNTANRATGGFGIQETSKAAADRTKCVGADSDRKRLAEGDFDGVSGEIRDIKNGADRYTSKNEPTSSTNSGKDGLLKEQQRKPYEKSEHNDRDIYIPYDRER